jgi:uncharacterized Fe-S cluster protein YjdI
MGLEIRGYIGDASFYSENYQYICHPMTRQELQNRVQLFNNVFYVLKYKPKERTRSCKMYTRNLSFSFQVSYCQHRPNCIKPDTHQFSLAFYVIPQALHANVGIMGYFTLFLSLSEMPIFSTVQKWEQCLSTRTNY